VPNLISCEKVKRLLKTCCMIVQLKFLAFAFSQFKSSSQMVHA
jgi:hypothetical protein